MMESKLLLMMKGKFESLFILYTVIQNDGTLKAWTCTEKGKKKTGDGGRTLVPSCHLLLSLHPNLFLNQDCRECKGLIILTFSLPNWSFPPPSSLPLLNHEAPPSFRLWISLCIIIGDEEFVNYYTRWLLFVILQSNIKATCCIKHGLWFNLLPPNALKCCS